MTAAQYYASLGAMLLIFVLIAETRQHARRRLDDKVFDISIAEWRQREVVLRYADTGVLVAFIVLYQLFNYASGSIGSPALTAFTAVTWSAVIGISGFLYWTQYKALRTALPANPQAVLIYIVTSFLVRIGCVAVIFAALLLVR